MNEFQAITIEIIFFALRFAVPALIIYTSARVVKRYMESEKESGDKKVAH